MVTTPAFFTSAGFITPVVASTVTVSGSDEVYVTVPGLSWGSVIVTCCQTTPVLTLP